MSVPTVFIMGSTDHPLALNGHKMAVMNSLSIRSLNSQTTSKMCHLNPLFRKSDVLPSITPSSRGSSAKSRTCLENTSTFRYLHPVVQAVRSYTGNDMITPIPKETHITYDEISRAVANDIVRFSSAPESKPLQEESETNSNCSDSNEVHELNKPIVKEFLQDLVPDTPFKQTNINTSGTRTNETRCASRTKRSKKKRKKRAKSKHSVRANRSVSKHKTALPAENVYMDTSLIKRNSEISELEAFCSPIHVGAAPIKQAKPVIDYLAHVSSKAPCAPRIIHNHVQEKPKLAERTKQFMATLPTGQNSNPPEYIKVNKEFIQKFHDLQTSVYAQKLTGCKASTISASSECLTFRPPLVKAVHHSMLRQSLGSAPGENVAPRVIKIFQSDKQSSDMDELGCELPCAPPATPVAEMSKGYEFVPCMSDIRSQRAVKMRLEALQKIEKQRNDKIREEKQRLEKINQKEKVRELRKQQRREIYALNKKMTQFENSNFKQFCSSNGIECNE